jgi:regulator of nucleoside diphosphate kinase
MAIDGVIWLPAQDYNRLRTLLSRISRGPHAEEAGIDTLEEILDLARVVNPEKVPGNVVTMNSRVQYEDLHTHARGTATIVYPADAEPTAGKISVLSPVGAALLGESEGSEIELPLPHNQKRRIRIDRVLYQPEAQGDYAL